MLQKLKENNAKIFLGQILLFTVTNKLFIKNKTCYKKCKGSKLSMENYCHRSKESSHALMFLWLMNLQFRGVIIEQ